METHNRIDTHLSKLIRLAELSAEKGDSSGQLNAFTTISGALDQMQSVERLSSRQILSCVSLLKRILILRQCMVRGNEIPPKKIPQVHHIAHTLNTLFVNSSKDAINTGDTGVITSQCEALFQAMDDLRSDTGLRTCGILDGRLKDAVGRLRERADIITLFDGEERAGFARIISSAEQALDGGDLAQIGEFYKKLTRINFKLKQKYPMQANLTSYLVKYRDKFTGRIKDRVNQIKKEAEKTSLFRCRALEEELTGLEELHQFHGDTGVSRQVRVLRNQIMAKRILPLESALETADQFIRETTHDHFTIGYQDRYIRAHSEDDIFTPAFYTHGLKELPPGQAFDLLRERQKKMNRVSVENAGQAGYETRLKEQLSALMKLLAPPPSSG